MLLYDKPYIILSYFSYSKLIIQLTLGYTLSYIILN